MRRVPTRLNIFSCTSRGMRVPLLRILDAPAMSRSCVVTEPLPDAEPRLRCLEVEFDPPVIEVARAERSKTSDDGWIADKFEFFPFSRRQPGQINIIIA